MTTITVHDVRARLRSRQRIRGIAVGVLFLLVASLTLAWIVKLAYRPRLAPLVTATVIDYDWPVAPNAWAGEDALRLASLDGRNLRLVDLSPDWRTRELALKRLDADLASLNSRGQLPATVIFYFSLHGVVDAQGQPHLLPADASPIDSTTWLPVSELVQRISDALPANTNKLILLDSNRSVANWRIGLLHNTFADRLAGVVDPQHHPGLVIVNSTAPDQIAWNGPALQGSLFGYHVTRGLAGAGADGQDRITLHQLVAFLRREMSAWCQQNRLPEQSIIQVPEEVADFPIAWPLSLPAITQALQGVELSSQPGTAATERDQLWRSASELPRQRLLAIVPEALSDLEHQLLWLEQLSTAGASYHRAAAIQLNAVRQQIDRITAAVQSSPQKRSPAAIRAELLDPNGRNFRGAAVPSLALGITLGSIDDDAATAAQSRWRELTSGVTPEQIEATIQALESTVGRGNQAGPDQPPSAASMLVDSHFLRLISVYQTRQRWPRRDPLTTLLQLRWNSESLSVLQAAGGAQPLRGLPWMTAALHQADQQRLLLEDLLLAGQAAAGEEIDAQVDAAQQAHQQAEQQLAAIADAFAVADDAQHRLPHFAMALASLMPQADSTTDDRSADPVSAIVIPALREAIVLNRQLDSPASASDDQTALPFLATAGRVTAAMDQLDRLLDQWIQRTTRDAAPESAMLPELKAALQLPWLPWQQRRQLRQIHDRLASSLVVPSSQQDAPGDDSPWGQAAGHSEQRRSLTTLDRLLAWPVHPAVLCCTATAETQQPGGDHADPSTIVVPSGRQRVERLGAVVRDGLSHFDGTAKASPWDDPGFTSADWLAAARWQRRSLPLGAAQAGTSPLQQVWSESLAELLMWHAQRQLASFYGPGPTRPTALAAKPFFDVACDRCLDMLDSLGPLSPELQQRRQRIRSQQTLRRLAARSALDTQVATSPLEVSDDQITVAVSIDPDDCCRESTGALPLGRASVWVQDQQGTFATTTGTVNLPLAESKSLTLGPTAPHDVDEDAAGTEAPSDDDQPSKAPTSEDSPLLRAVTMFRGNEYAQPFMVNRLAGTQVRYRPHRYAESSITLLGQRRKRASIMFVLDCSRSMEQPLSGESADQPGPPRLELAKGALTSMLDELSRHDGTRIGVILLGHRIAWTRSDPPQRSVSPAAGAEIPAGLLPSRDVETILPLGRFDSGRVLERLDQVQPWGQTPLHLAIIEALQAFAVDDPDTEKSVVVITDGIDYQFTPSRSDIRQPSKVTQEELLSTARQVGVPVYILGFGIEPELQPAAGEQFGQLAKVTDGESMPVDNASDLLQRMRDKLVSGSFTVQTDAAAASASQPGRVSATLNGTVQVDPRAAPQGEYTLVFESASTPLQLAGGEALQIGLSSDGREFQPLPFQWQFPQAADLVSGADARQSEYRFRAHRPIRRGDSVLFPVSVQSTRRPMTPRPAEAWLTVTPLVDGAEVGNHRYHFFDPNYEPNQPVPLLQWQADDWPTAAQAARLDFWCKFDQTTPLRTIPLRDVLHQPQQYTDWAIPEQPSVHLQISVSDREQSGDAYLVNVIQRQQSPDADPSDLRVEFRHAPHLQPRQVAHRFDAANGIASHTFTFAAEDAAALERSQRSAIVLTTRSATQTGALRLPGGRGIDVELYGAADVIQLNSPQ